MMQTRDNSREADSLHVAVVHSGDEICFVTAASSADALARRIADYVRDRAAHRLWPDDARAVEELLGMGLLREAASHYFGTVGRRWDNERLVVTAVPAEARHVPRDRCRSGPQGRAIPRFRSG